MSLHTQALAERNISYIQQDLLLGMSQVEVLEVMNQPYGHAKIELNQKIYEVWFYITRASILGQTSMTLRNLTPLIFEKGRLSDWGYAAYRTLLSKKNRPEDSSIPVIEDFDLEKDLNK